MTYNHRDHPSASVARLRVQRTHTGAECIEEEEKKNLPSAASTCGRTLMIKESRAEDKRARHIYRPRQRDALKCDIMRWPAAESELCEGRRRGVPSEAICVMRRQEVRHPPSPWHFSNALRDTHADTLRYNRRPALWREMDQWYDQARPLLMTLVSRSDVFSRPGCCSMGK